MNLRDKLNEKTVILPIQSSTQADVIQELLIHLQKIEILSNTIKLYKKIKNNEAIVPCAAGRGIAYPHSTSIEVEELTSVLGISKDGIDFNAPDGQLCHIILLTLSPDEAPSEHRKFITRFRIMFDDPNLRSSLLDANQPKEVINIIQKWEDDDALIDDLN